MDAKFERIEFSGGRRSLQERLDVIYGMGVNFVGVSREVFECRLSHLNVFSRNDRKSALLYRIALTYGCPSSRKPNTQA